VKSRYCPFPADGIDEAGGFLERLIKLELLGQEYPLRTDAAEEDVEEILNLVRAQVNAFVDGSKKAVPVDKIAILASVNMAGDYIRLKRDFERYRRHVGTWIERVTEKVESGL